MIGPVIISEVQLGNLAERLIFTCYEFLYPSVFCTVVGDDTLLYFNDWGDFCDRCGQVSIVQSLCSPTVDVLKGQTHFFLMRHSILRIVLG